MKKLTIFALCAALLAVVSCGGNSNQNDNTKNAPAAAAKSSADAVDLGVVITREDGTTYNLYWAKSNLSRSGLCANPEDYGDYYAWGETVLKNDYTSHTYKYGAYPNLIKYNTKDNSGTVDNRTVLDPEDDVAHVILGGKWRMPTIAEWEALIKQCSFTWATRNGVEGQLATGPNGNSIFLPAAGWRQDERLNYAGTTGEYWSSSLHPNYQNYACGSYFSSGNVRRDMSARCYGLSVRPVSE